MWTCKTSGRSTISLTALAFLAQVGTYPVLAQRAGSGPSFMSVRFASRSSLTFYGGYAVGPALGFVGFVQNPRSQYREAIVGVGKTVGTARGPSALIGVAAAYATDGWYTQVYVLPSVHAGRLELSGTLEFYAPLEEPGSLQFDATPAYGYLIVSPRVAFGGTYVVAVQRGQPTGHALGPSVRVAIPRGSIAIDVVRRLTVLPHELRVTVQSRF
jgi:hypothetical protein